MTGTLVLLTVVVLANLVVAAHQAARAVYDYRCSRAGSRLRDLHPEVQREVRQRARQLLGGDITFGTAAHVVLGLAVMTPATGVALGLPGVSRLALCSTAGGLGSWLGTLVPGAAIASCTSTAVLLFKAYHQPISPLTVPLPRWWPRWMHSDPAGSGRLQLLDQIRMLVAPVNLQWERVDAAAWAVHDLSPIELQNRLDILLRNIYEAGCQLRQPNGQQPTLEVDRAAVSEILGHADRGPASERHFYYASAIDRLWSVGGALALTNLERNRVIDLTDRSAAGPARRPHRRPR
jgi:hypothetical protein